MASDQRVIKIDNPETIVTFSICNDIKEYADKDIFEYLKHNPDGKICFIETFLSRKFSRKMLREIEIMIVNKYKNVEKAIWMRPMEETERVFTYKRRYYEACV